MVFYCVFHGIPWYSIVFYVSVPWFHGIPWYSIVFYVSVPWYSMVFDCVRLCSMAFYVCLMAFVGIRWHSFDIVLCVLFAMYYLLCVLCFYECSIVFYSVLCVTDNNNLLPITTICYR